MAAFTFKHGDRPLEGYTIQRGVGRGGFGEVYFAVSDGGKEVAIKYLRENPSVELRGVSHCLNLKSPHLVTLFDVRQSGAGEYFIVMEYISGPTLRDLLIAESAGLGVEKAAYLLREIGKGLAFLHGRDIVHRDLKPGNIFCEDGQIKIGDYGLAKCISVSPHSVQTASIGTVHYMAPEMGSGHYSRGVDIYALGVMLYEMLLGRVPFDGSTMGEVLMKHLTAQPDVDELPAPFPEVIRKALAKDPKDRYASVAEMIAALFAGSDLERSVGGLDPASLTVRAAAAVNRGQRLHDAPSPAYVLGPGTPGSGSSELHRGGTAALAMLDGRGARGVRLSHEGTGAAPSSEVSLRSSGAQPVHVTWPFTIAGLLLICLTPLPLVAGALLGRSINAAILISCGACLLAGTFCLLTGRWWSSPGGPRKARLSLPLRRVLFVPRRDDLDALIIRYFLSLKYQLRSQDRLLWSFEWHDARKRRPRPPPWHDASGEWGSDDVHVHVSVAAFEIAEGYRVTCHLELSGLDSVWATEPDLRNLARDLDGLEDVLGAVPVPARDSRIQAARESFAGVN